MQDTKVSIQELNAMKPLQILEDERIKGRVVSMFMKLHNTEEDEANHFYEKEKYNFSRIIQDSEDLKQCTGFSIYGCFLDLASMGLTLENISQPLVYLLWGNAKVGDKYEKRATLEISPYGELVLRMQAGQLQYADSPVIVYDGDKFKPIVNDRGQKICLYEASIPRQSKKIIGSFIRLTRPDNSFDFFYMLPDDIERLKRYSAKKNKTSGANSLYSSNDGDIDPGFLAAKTIKHAFKTFPKVRIGQFSKLQETEPIQAVDYGLTETIPQDQLPPKPLTQAFSNTPQEQIESFEQEGVTVEDDDEVF